MLINLDEYLFTNYFFVYEEYYKKIAHNPNIMNIAEVGSWKGHSIAFLAKEMLSAGKNNFNLYAIDIWEAWDTTNPEQQYIYEIYNKILNINGVRKYIKDVKMQSHLGANNFTDGSLDFVYIDANHSYEYAKRDILSWLPKVKKGGILAGHDYYMLESNGNDVKTAVDELCKNGILPNFEFFPGNVWSTQL
jgi:predicted O-methyltransferase YrrM